MDWRLQGHDLAPMTHHMLLLCQDCTIFKKLIVLI